ncbi:MAG TPA: hypothetical protein V6C86_21715 [Oculatellaceae cyanobacterium]
MSVSVARKSAVVRFPWMFGLEHDLFFFFLSALIGLAVYGITQSTLSAKSIILAALIPTAFGIGPFHQGPTWFMYFDSKNRAYYGSTQKQRWIYFFGPPLIVLASVVSYVYFKPLVLGIWFVWSLQHLVQQNVGILLLYHNHRGNEAIVERKHEVLTLQVPAVLFALLFVRRALMMNQSNIWFDGFLAVLAVYTFFLVIGYLMKLRKLVVDGKALNLPALAFWALSVLALWPMAALGRDFGEAAIAPLTWHWFQYIGLNWKLMRNKYSRTESETSAFAAVDVKTDAEANSQSANLPGSSPVGLFFIVCFSLVVVNIGLSVWSRVPDVSTLMKDAIVGLLLGLVNAHYFVDAFVWRFREPFQRTTILPYLKDTNAQTS